MLTKKYIFYYFTRTLIKDEIFMVVTTKLLLFFFNQVTIGATPNSILNLKVGTYQQYKMLLLFRLGIMYINYHEITFENMSNAT